MKKSFMTRILATGLSLAMAFSMAAATNVTTASAASKPAMITSAGASAKSLSLKVGEVTKIKVNAATKANYKVSAVKASSKRVRAAVVGSTVVAIRGLKATVEGKPSTVKVSFKSRKTNKTSKFTYSSKVTVIEDKLTVTGVSLANATTLTVTGTKLGDLTAADIKITPAINVASYSAATDGKTATVALASAMMSATKYTVEVAGQSFEVSYTAGEITSVAITETTYDDDTASQTLALTVNGGTPITVNDLVADGYYVSFNATKNGTAKKIFKGTTTATVSGSAASFTGELVPKFEKTTNAAYPDALVDSYQVQVVLSKGSSIITSPLATIKIANLNAVATEIKSYVFTADAGTRYVSGVALTSTTLVTGDKAELTKTVITTKDGTVDLPSAVLSLVKVTSSDKGIINVNTSTGKVHIEAVAPGTATLTFAYGSVSKTVTYTVTNTARKVNTVVAKDAVVRVTATGNAANTKIVVKDQYGEFISELPIESAENAPAVAYSKGIVHTSKVSVATASAVTGTKTDVKGEFPVTVKGRNDGDAYLMFSYYDDNNNKTAYIAASIAVTAATEVDSTKNQLYAIGGTNASDDFSINVYNTADKTVGVALKTFTKDGALVKAPADIQGYSFKFNKAIVDVVTTGAISSTTDDDGSTLCTIATGTAIEHVTFSAINAGSTTVTLFDQDGNYAASTVITVTNTTPKLTAVTFNSACPASLTVAGEYVQLGNVFNLKASSNDTIIEGITISVPYAGELRLNPSNATNAAIYIDANSDGKFVAGDGDVTVGSIVMTAKNTSGADTPFAATDSFKYTLGSAPTGEKVLYYTVTDATTGNVIATKTISVSK